MKIIKRPANRDCHARKREIQLHIIIMLLHTILLWSSLLTYYKLGDKYLSHDLSKQITKYGRNASTLPKRRFS